MAKPRILVHICCAADGLYVIDLLKKEYEVTGYFYNPNIFPAQEYQLRLAETKKVAVLLGMELLEDVYDPENWLLLAQKYSMEPEMGKRCEICFAIRLKKTAMKAVELGFDSFTTVMSVSPWKRAEVLNNLGKMFGEKYGVPFLQADFKKKNGFKKSVELSKHHHLYRQDYCGCIYSKEESERRRRVRQGKALRIVVFGVVQGVGFRPFVYRLAHRFRLHGWVKNFGFGVEIHLEGKEDSNFDEFLRALREEKPPLAQIENITVRPVSFEGYKDFIIEKTVHGESFIFISPDIATCDKCLEEIFNPQERRFRYPFTNCTDCGPRYTIVNTLPYDRSQTTMAHFQICPDCGREYSDPLDRRYHAQPIACPRCGPQISLLEARTGKKISGGIEKATTLIREGKILAVKGLGGFHLVCDPFRAEAVKRLRKIKERKRKPLALMAANIETVKKHAFLSGEEKEFLLSARRPIVLLEKKKDIKNIAPHLSEIGFILPYTPLHHLLLQKIPLIVATSSNKKDAPIIKEEKEGIQELCDYVLTHNRPIASRADDSVLKIVDGQPLFLRRARGFVPYPQKVPEGLRSSCEILALGGELKDTISVYKNGYIITSQFLGDLDEYENFRYFEETIAHLRRLFEVQPDVVVTDLHPDFHTTRYAQKLGIPHLQVQHHFAHVLAPLLERQVPPGQKVLGVAFDGYGYGTDGTGWGSEFLISDYSSYQRIASFQPLPLPGGDLAAKQPWRMALVYLRKSFSLPLPEVPALQKVSLKKRRTVLEMIDKGLSCPLSTSCGRLFDSVSFILGLSPLEVEFEAEAPMRLEAIARSDTQKSYNFFIEEKSLPFRISFSQTFVEIIDDLRKKIPLVDVATKFHNTLAEVIVAMAQRARRDFGIQTVVLAGGVFLNRRLLKRATSLLEEKGFSVLRPVNYSPNDESLSLGQIAYGLATLKK